MNATNGRQTAPVVGRDEQGVAIRWQMRNGHHTAWYTWDELERYNIKIEEGKTV